jgi:diguanylate cyclase (GGDEF)-like protein/PAS domain S-box-containing protein
MGLHTSDMTAHPQYEDVHQTSNIRPDGIFWRDDRITLQLLATKQAHPAYRDFPFPHLKTALLHIYYSHAQKTEEDAVPRRVIMPQDTISQLMAKNASLQERLAELEARLADYLAGETMLTEDAIAERKRIDYELKTSEIRYRRLFETAKDGILILDADTGLIIDSNPFIENLLGFAHEELIDKTLWEIGPFRDVAASREAFQQLQAKEYARYENLPLETKGKESREVEFISNVYLVNGTRVIQCNIRDITERIRAEAKLRVANEELATLVTELRKRDAQMQLLNRMNDLLQACKTQEEAYQVIALMADELFAGQDGCLAVLRPGNPDLELVARWGETPQVESTFSIDDCWAMRRGQPHEVLDPQASLLCRHFADQPAAGYLCIPLTVQGESLGLLCLMGDVAKTGERRISQRNLALTLGEAIKLSLFNLRLQEKLREQATRDPLTGLFNRRYLEDSLDRELHRAQRQKSALSIVMLDLDHFKQFNDTFGHDAGDLLLRELGKVLRTVLRQSDISCRYGGEEFVLVFPDSSLADTRKRVEEIRVLVKGLNLRHGDRLLGTITVSAGIATAPEHGSTVHDLICSADDALYTAKQGGRDRLVAFQAKA